MRSMLFEDTEWHTPWMPRVLPAVVALAGLYPERTIFTRFLPADREGEGGGTWRRYYPPILSKVIAHCFDKCNR